ncbi:hypothetical protein ACFLR1_01175 [Bacteroidota bacterium]
MKSEFLSHCILLARQKAQSLEKELASTREATSSESKSTAGDKHETGRAMMHLEQEKLHMQLAEAQNVSAELERINPSVAQDKISLGSLIETDKGKFFLAAGLGKVVFKETAFFVVSPKAPISAQFIGKKAGHTASMNGMLYKILSVK